MWFVLAAAIDDKLKTIDDIDEELTELEDMVEQLEQYTGALRTSVTLLYDCIDTPGDVERVSSLLLVCAALETKFYEVS